MSADLEREKFNPINSSASIFRLQPTSIATGFYFFKSSRCEYESISELPFPTIIIPFFCGRTYFSPVTLTNYNIRFSLRFSALVQNAFDGISNLDKITVVSSECPT